MNKSLQLYQNLKCLPTRMRCQKVRLTPHIDLDQESGQEDIQKKQRKKHLNNCRVYL